MPLTDWEILRDLDFRMAQQQNALDRHYSRLMSEFQLFRQETQFHRAAMLDRLAKLEARASKPTIDWTGIFSSLWFKLAILAALGAGNKELLDAVSASLR